MFTSQSHEGEGAQEEDAQAERKKRGELNLLT
jgi:hypothetical protein